MTQATRSEPGDQRVVSAGRQAKPKPITIVGCVRDGKLQIATSVWKQFGLAFRRWPEGASVEIEAQIREERRRVKQNNAYWYALGEMERASLETNQWTKDEWHVFYAQKFNGKVLTDIDQRTGEITEIRVGLTTTKLNIEDFGVYLDRVLLDIAERSGLVIQFEDAATRGERMRAA